MSTPAHTTLSVQQLVIITFFFTKNGMIPLPHPPYSPDLTPRGFFVSPMKKVLKGKHFANVKDVRQKTTETLKGINIDEFKNCFEQRKPCLGR